MSTLKQFFVFFIVIGVLTSCASNIGGYTSTEEVETRIIGMTAEEVATKLGAPTEQVSISDNVQVWSYRSKAMGLTGGECEVIITIKKGIVTSATVNKNDLSPLVAPLGSCRRIIGKLD